METDELTGADIEYTGADVYVEAENEVFEPYEDAGTEGYVRTEEEADVDHEAQLSVSRRSRSNESDEEIHLRMRTHRKPSESPGRSEKMLSISTTTTTVCSQYIDNDASNDVENVGSAVSRVKSNADRERASSASGVLTKVRGSKRAGVESPLRNKEGIRKTSGRIGSVGNGVASATAASTAAPSTAAC